MPTFERLTKAGLKSLAPGERISEHGIYYEKLKNGNGRYGVHFRVDGQSINRVVGKESDGVTRGDAEALMERIKTESRENRLKLTKGRKTAISFKEAGQRYIEKLKQVDGKNIKRKEKQLSLHLVPFFGASPVDSLSTFDIGRYKTFRKNKGTALATINSELALLSHLYSCAKEWGWITHKPFEVKKFPLENRRINYLTPEQCGALLKVASTTDHQLYLFIKIGLATGMRLSEILAIKLENIDLTHKRVYVPEAKAGARNQPITSDLADYLTFYRKQYCLDGQEWLFPSKESKTGHRVSIRKAFRAAIEAIGLDPAVYLRHTMRHTMASLLIQAGVDVHTVMTIGGWKTQVMVERYSHRDGAHIQAAMDKLEEKISQPQTPTLEAVKEA